MNEEFVTVLKQEIHKQGLSNAQAGKLVGCSGRLVSYYIRGERTPTLDMADKILKALGAKMTIGITEKEEEQNG